MSHTTILDTGPLVALLNARDRHHAWVRGQWDMIDAPLLTCEAVIGEACFLARRLGRDGQNRVLEFVRRGAVDLSFPLEDEIDAVARLAERYRDIPMSLADACLVRMSEIHREGRILTLDRDFTIYRKNRRQRIALLSPYAGPTGLGE